MQHFKKAWGSKAGSNCRAGGTAPTTPTLVGPKILSFTVIIIIRLFAITPLQVLAIQRKKEKRKKKGTVKEHTTKYKATKLRTV